MQALTAIARLVIGPTVLIGQPATAVQAGFPSPGQDLVGQKIDLNEILIQDPTSTFIVRVTGDSMSEAGIADGDEVIVDRSIRPRDGAVVIAVVNGEMTIKRLRIRSDGIFLVPENRKYPVLKLDEHAELDIWGTVTRCLHKVD